MPERTLRFQQKLFQIVNNCRSGAVFWSDTGDSVIFKFSQFKKEYLDRSNNFCKSNKIASFIRQLNLYGFRKLVKSSGYSKKRAQDYHEFQNIYFQRGRKDLLEHVIRNFSTSTVPKKNSGDGRIKKRGRKAKKGRRKKIDMLECNEDDHQYGRKQEVKAIGKPKTRKAYKTVLNEKGQFLFKIFRDLHSGQASNGSAAKEMLSAFPSYLERAVPLMMSKGCQSENTDHISSTPTHVNRQMCSALKFHPRSTSRDRSTPSANCDQIIPVNYRPEKTSENSVMAIERNSAEKKLGVENHPPMIRKKSKHHLRKSKFLNQKRWDYLLDDFEYDGSEDITIDCRYGMQESTCLSPEDFPETSWNKRKYDHTDIYEMEFLELAATRMRMQSNHVPAWCLCNSNIAPCMTRRYSFL